MTPVDPPAALACHPAPFPRRARPPGLPLPGRRTLTALGLALGLAGLTAALPTPALAAQTLIPAQSEIVFVSTQMGVPVEGRFRQFEAQVDFDPGNPAASRVQLDVATGSATVGVKETDAELPKPTWFNVAAFPKARFESTAIKAVGPGRYEVAGRLSIKGLSRDVLVPVAMTQSAGTTVATGTLAIPRLGFKIGENEWADTSMVADQVTIRFKIALSGVPALPAR